MGPGGVHTHGRQYRRVRCWLHPEGPPLRRVVAGLLILIVTAGACAADAPKVPIGPDGEPDPVLVLGREVYSDRCANCHGSSGGGDRGPKISDRSTLERYPDVVDQVAFVAAGKGLMPGFGGKLTNAELEAVVRYVRAVL